jgi:hypothetical protein
MARAALFIIGESPDADNNNSGSPPQAAGQAGGYGRARPACLMRLTQFSAAII